MDIVNEIGHLACIAHEGLSQKWRSGARHARTAWRAWRV